MVLPVRLDEVDQAVGGGVVIRHLVVVRQVTFDGLCQSFAQLNAPLIERIDVPNDALRENLVLVGGDKGTESKRCQLLDDNRVGWTISGEDLVRNEILQFVSFHAGLFQLGANFLLGLAKSESFCLRQEVGEQQLVMNSTSNWVVSLSCSDEVSWNHASALK